MHAMLLVVLAGLVWSTAGEAANCRKGIPCGNSCIAANRTCHLNTPARPPDTPKMQSGPAAPAPVMTAPGAAATPAGAAVGAAIGAAVVNGLSGPQGLWAASEVDRVYFAPGCAVVQDLAAANRRYFPDEAAAQAAGFRRSSVPGC